MAEISQFADGYPKKYSLGGQKKSIGANLNFYNFIINFDKNLVE
jgi:hypothetical protein